MLVDISAEMYGQMGHEQLVSYIFKPGFKP